MYLNFDWGESRFKSVFGRICCRLDLGTGVKVNLLKQGMGALGLQNIGSLATKGVCETISVFGFALAPIMSSSD